jgi:undecaprenyl phosphate N,N'-diacetylbacillosamine 1-phosphate transferase
MKDLYTEDGILLPDEERITKLGTFLRKFSIDEIPQLFNILKLEVSFIGPRPLLVEYLPLYNDEQIKRHNVKPGVSGLAQVNGRNATSWEERLNYDIEYVHNISFLLDAQIFFLTLKKVFLADGVTTESGKSMPKFTGSQSNIK